MEGLGGGDTLEQIASQAELMVRCSAKESVRNDGGAARDVVHVLAVPLTRVGGVTAVDDKAGKLLGVEPDRLIHRMTIRFATRGIPDEPKTEGSTFIRLDCQTAFYARNRGLGFPLDQLGAELLPLRHSNMMQDVWGIH